MFDTLNFISWNVNGIRAVHKKGALNWIGYEDYDIVSLQEIKAEAEQIPHNVLGRVYKHEYINSSHKKGQSGVALFTDIEPVYYSECHEVDILHEGRINEMHFADIAFFNVYFPNGQRNSERLQYKLEFYERFFERIESLRSDGKSVIFCGDVNTAHKPIDLARPEENSSVSGFLPEERAWIDKITEAGYIDTFRYIHPDEKDRYSWWSMRTMARSRNIGWRIDYFFVSEDLKERIVDADILDNIEGSDHAPVTLRLALE